MTRYLIKLLTKSPSKGDFIDTVYIGKFNIECHSAKQLIKDHLGFHSRHYTNFKIRFTKFWYRRYKKYWIEFSIVKVKVEKEKENEN